MESGAAVACKHLRFKPRHPCTSNICHKCKRRSPKGILRPLKRKKIRQAGAAVEDSPGANKSSDSDKSLSKVAQENNPPNMTTTTTEHRLRILHTDNSHDVQESSKSTVSRAFKLKSVSSSTAHYSGTSSSLSDTVIEEHWTQSTLTSISLLRITSSSFKHHPFLTDPSYGKDVTQLTFEGPCSPNAISRALETFPGVQSLEFAPGFFIYEDFGSDCKLPYYHPEHRKAFPRIKSLTIKCDVKKYFKMTSEDKTSSMINFRIVSLLKVAIDGFKHLNHCSVTLPNNIAKVDENLDILIGNGPCEGQKWTEDANNVLRYEALSVDKPYPSTPISSRKRKASSPSQSGSAEVVITGMVSKEDKIQHVNLSSSSSSDDEEQENKNGVHCNNDKIDLEMVPGPSQPRMSTRMIPSPPHVTLSSNSSDEEDGVDEMRSQVAPVSRLLDRHSNISNTIPNRPIISMPAQPSEPQPFLQDTANSREQQVITCLSSSSWRETNKGKWDSFDCSSIRIGDYKLICSSIGAGAGTTTTTTSLAVGAMVFSDRGIYFQFPHFKDDKRKSINIGIPIDDITEVKMYSGDFSSFIFLKTTESCSAWIRGVLEMSNTEESNGHFSASSKYPCQQFIQFRIVQSQQQPTTNRDHDTSRRTQQDLFKTLFRRSNLLLQELESMLDLEKLQIETFCKH